MIELLLLWLRRRRRRERENRYETSLTVGMQADDNLDGCDAVDFRAHVTPNERIPELLEENPPRTEAEEEERRRLRAV